MAGELTVFVDFGTDKMHLAKPGTRRLLARCGFNPPGLRRSFPTGLDWSPTETCKRCLHIASREGEGGS
jgi:hypothetical protein